jgi:hypothetical protein
MGSLELVGLHEKLVCSLVRRYNSPHANRNAESVIISVMITVVRSISVSVR